MDKEIPIQVLIKQYYPVILTIRKLVSSIFKNAKGQPLILSDGQCLVFHAITDPIFRWVWISGPTRYGKTDTIAVALLFCATAYHLRIPIVGGSMDKANKIMEYILQHISDHSSLAAGLLNVKDASKVEMLKVQASKTALRWSHGGWIYITSVDSRSKTKEGEGVVGEGGDIVVLEEAGLIKDEDQFSKIVRMPEENNGWGKLVMSGNCVERSVFEKAYNNPIYHKIRVTQEQAQAEGRYTKDLARIEAIKAQTTTKDWKRYHLVEFPLANEFTYFKPKMYELLPKDLKYYGAIDPSLGETEKSSKIGIMVLGYHEATGLRYEIESVIKQIGPDEAVKTIFNFPYIFQRFGFETVGFQKYFLKQTKELNLQLGMNIPFEGINQSKNKEERIESMEPFINTGQILFKGGNQLWDDMGEYPKTEFLDGLDALEMAYRISEKKKPNFYIGGETY